MTGPDTEHTNGHRPAFGLPHEPDPASALSTAALVALHAPSVHNTQPWHWRVGTDRVDLYADERWRLRVADPDGRLLVLSCGAALHHARVALRAMGFLPSVRRFPDRTRPDLLASLAVDKPIPVTAQALDLMRATTARHTDRRGIADSPVPERTLAVLREAAGSEGAWLHLLNDDQVRTVVAAAARAEAVEMGDAAFRRELDSWTNRPADVTVGIPATVHPPRGDEYSRTGHYAVLYGSGDRPTAWLRAGEALSAVWLTATAHGLAIRPISAVIEIPAGRAVLHKVLSGVGSPYLMLRIGVPVGTNGVSMTPRRPAEESVGLLTEPADEAASEAP